MSGIYNLPEPTLDPPEPVIVGTCHHCKEDIERGDDIVSFDGVDYHHDCFMDCAANILFDRYGAVARVAEEDDGYDG